VCGARGPADVARTPIVCLVPVRNEVGNLEGFLASAARVADAVVALDDGSTDGSGDVLRAHPLVARVLESPPRDGFAGWDDGANRNRLLRAAGELEPGWILSLDADERMDADDAAALRAFVAREARPGFGYLLPWQAMRDDEEHCSPVVHWLARLFAHRPGQRFADARLHAPALPTGIPRARLVRTTFRIKHLGGMTAEDRAARYAKYRQADPQRRFQRSYESLLHPRGTRVAWTSRPPELPALANGAHPVGERASGEPVLSIVTIAQDDASRIGAVLDALGTQVVPGAVELIVVCSGSDATARIARARRPDATVVELGAPALPGAARNAGLRLARGRYVSFAGSHVELAPGALAARIAAHDRGYAMVGGLMANGTLTAAGWASYLLDNPTAFAGRRSGPLARAPVRCSYLRAALVAAGGFPEDLRAGEDTVVNERLFALGYGAYRDAAIRSTHHSPCDTPRRLIAHHVARGRSMGAILAGDRDGATLRDPRRVPRFIAGAGPRRLAFSIGAALRWGGTDRRRLLAAVPLASVAAVASWFAACVQLGWLRTRRQRAQSVE
jgi:glycosyltransferase involved in cell wall biosynthesis